MMAESKFKEYVVGLRDDTNDPYTASVHEPIVRCKDCERCKYTRFYHHGTEQYTCTRLLAHSVKPDDFCSWGVRREDL